MQHYWQPGTRLLMGSCLWKGSGLMTASGLPNQKPRISLAESLVLLDVAGLTQMGVLRTRCPEVWAVAFATSFLSLWPVSVKFPGLHMPSGYRILLVTS